MVRQEQGCGGACSDAFVENSKPKASAVTRQVLRWRKHRPDACFPGLDEGVPRPRKRVAARAMQAGDSSTTMAGGQTCASYWNLVHRRRTQATGKSAPRDLDAARRHWAATPRRRCPNRSDVTDTPSHTTGGHTSVPAGKQVSRVCCNCSGMNGLAMKSWAPLRIASEIL